jgi:hypothetical protein
MRNPSSPVVASRCQTPAGIGAARRGRGRRYWRLGRWSAGVAAGALWLSFGACTLTGEEFEPALIDRASLVPDAAAPSVGMCRIDTDCTGGNVCRSGACVVAEPSDGGVSAPCSGADCSGGVDLPLAPTCDDGTQNGDEAGIDCGGSCPRGCPIGTACAGDADCREGLFCPVDTSLCATASCSDGVQNGDEAGADCGGSCPGCPDGTVCTLGSDCESGVCAGTCSAPTCDDGVVNQDETGTDCGGSCALGCGSGEGCLIDSDCGEGSFCPPGVLRCTAISCADGVQNGDEVLTDCGGGCAGCPDGSACSVGRDCQSGACTAAVCTAPSCNDRVSNQDETGIDCGGSCAQNCPVGGGCSNGGDCQTGVCGGAGCDEALDRCCQAPSCNDGVSNGSETAVDCGNNACGPCPLGSPCTADGQCALAFCQQGQCRNPGTCTDGNRNGRETDIDCGGNRCPACGDRAGCAQDADCANQNCDASGVCNSCGDGVQDGTETAVDCGGADLACPRCSAGQACGSNDDCAAGVLCIAGLCNG